MKALIGEGDYTDDDAITAAADTALGQIFSELCISGRAEIWLQSPRLVSNYGEFRHTPQKVEVFALSGTAYSFRVFGKGRVRISDGGATDIREFDGYGVVFRGFINTGGTVSFEGELAYTVKSLAFFSELFERKLDSIPILGEQRRISINSTVRDFSSPIGVPEDKQGKALGCVRLERDELVATEDFTGEVCFTYRKRPPKPSLMSGDDELGLAEEIDSLLVNLTVSYLLSVSDSDAAEAFEENYVRTVKALAAEYTAKRSCKYTDYTGWA